MRKPLLEIRNLSKRFGGLAAVSVLNLDVRRAVPGAVLAAAYMLRMLQKVVWGGTNNPDQSYLTDLNVREIITLAPLLLFVLWIGLNPAPFMDVMHTSVSHLIQQVGIADVSQQGIFEVAKLAIPH